MVAVVALAGCKAGSAATKATVPSTSTTSTTAPPASQLTIVGVRPGVLQAPFYPQITVSQVSCGVDPGRGRFVRVDLPPGGAGTPAHTVFTKPTAVIVVPGAAVVVDPRYLHRVLYDEAMKNITTGTQGVFVLSMVNFYASGGDGLTVEAGAMQLNGGYQCPATDVAYPGT
jgi:hypothetical protein